MAHLYRSGDPSILRLIQMVLRAAEKHGKHVTVCGQMSSDPRFIPLLLGMGLRSLSVTPQAIPRLKEVVRNLSISEAERISQHACSLDLARDVEHYLQGELSRLAPDLVDEVGFWNDFFAIVGEARLEDLCRNSVVSENNGLAMSFVRPQVVAGFRPRHSVLKITVRRRSSGHGKQWMPGHRR